MPGLSFEIVRPKEIHLVGRRPRRQRRVVRGRRAARPPASSTSSTTSTACCSSSISTTSQRKAALKELRRRTVQELDAVAGAPAAASSPPGRLSCPHVPVVRAASRSSARRDRRRAPLRALVRRRLRGRPRRHPRRQAPVARRERDEPSPVKAAALELGLPGHAARSTTCSTPASTSAWSSPSVSSSSRTSSTRCRWSTSTSRCCRDGGARRRSSGRSSPATRDRRVHHAVEEGLDTGAVFACERVHDRRPHDRRRAAGRARSRSARACSSSARATGFGAPSRRTGEPTYAAKLEPATSRSTGRGPPLEVDRVVRVGQRVDDVPRPAAEGARRQPDRGATASAGVLAGVEVGTGDGGCRLGRGAARGASRIDAAAWRNGARVAARRTARARDRRSPTARRRARRARPHRARRRLREPRAARAAVAQRPLRPRSGVRHRARLRHDAHAASVRLARRPLRHAAPSTCPCATALRLGAYQLAFLGTPPHAAVSATGRGRPSHAAAFVNAILRRVADAPVECPDDATRLSYPDWIVDRLDRRPRRATTRSPRSSA